MIKRELQEVLRRSIRSAREEAQVVLNDDEVEALDIAIQRPQLPEHGDLCSPVAMQIASRMARPEQAMEVAHAVIAKVKSRSENAGLFTGIEAVAPGYINFGLGPRLAANILLKVVCQGEGYGLSGFAGRERAGRSKCSMASQEPAIERLQIAYARCSSILRQATDPRVDILNNQLEAPIMTSRQWLEFLRECQVEAEIYRHLDLFEGEGEGHSNNLWRSQAQLILNLGFFPEELSSLANYRQGEDLLRLFLVLAEDLTSFLATFNLGQGFFNAQLSVLKARLGLILATRQVLGNALGIMDLPVMEQM